MENDKTIRLFAFLDETTDYFLSRAEGVDRDAYFADRDKRNIRACHEYIGDIVLKISPLVKHRNETIHQYLKVNWQNIVIVKSKMDAVREFAEKMRKLLVE